MRSRLKIIFEEKEENRKRERSVKVREKSQDN